MFKDLFSKKGKIYLETELSAGKIKELDEAIALLSDVPISSETNCTFPEAYENAIAKNYRAYYYFLLNSNGGYSKDHCIHFYGKTGPQVHNVFMMNEHSFWKQYYGLTDNDFCFAESIFGNQYYFKLNKPEAGIFCLYIETGDIDKVNESFDQFLNWNLFSDLGHDVYSEIFREIIKHCGSEKLPIHLGTKKPLLFGADESDPLNYGYIDPIIHLSFTGQLFMQLKKLKPGTHIKQIDFDREKLELRIIV